MHIDWNVFVTALGLALILEGLFYAIFSDRVPALLMELARRGPSALRSMGLMTMCAGVLLVWLVRRVWG